MTEEANQGQREARTRSENSGGTTIDAKRERLAAGFAALAAKIGDAGDAQPDLLDGSPDLEPNDLLSLAANRSNEVRRARGRPQGSQNKRNADVFDYLAALGHRDPAVTLSMIQSADAGDLAMVMGCTKLEALALIKSAAAELMPFKYAKRPQAIEVTKTERHLFLAGSFDMALPADQGGSLDITNGAYDQAPIIDNDGQ